MKKSWLLAAGFLSLGVLAGCQSTAKPDLTNPGNAAVQQKRALRYDPYPSTDVGGGSMAGTRPSGYEIPPAEPTQARWNRSPDNAERWGTTGNE
jgi:hypothetical protein